MADESMSNRDKIPERIEGQWIDGAFLCAHWTLMPGDKAITPANL